jgi:hypothetical protein
MRDAPCILVRFELKQPVRVRTNFEAGDAERMGVWLTRHPEHWDLIERALDIAQAEADTA